MISVGLSAHKSGSARALSNGAIRGKVAGIKKPKKNRRDRPRDVLISGGLKMGEDGKGFKVTDKRRFSEEGEALEGAV